MGDRTTAHNALARLHSASRALAQATNTETVTAALLGSAEGADGANAAAVVIPHRDGSLELVGSTFPDETVRSSEWSVDSALPINDVLRTGESVWLCDRDELRARYPGAPAWTKCEAWVALPLRVGERIIGGLAVGFAQRQQFTADDRRYLMTLADMCAVVLERRVLEPRRTEHQLSALVESNGVGVISGHETIITEANDAFLDLLGLERDDVARGLDYRSITAREWLDADERAAALADEDGRFGPYEKEFVHRDGHHVPVRIVGAGLAYDEHGRWFSLVEDLSASRAAEADRHTSEARYRSLVEAISTIVWSADESGHFGDPEPSWTAYTGQAPDHARDYGWLDAFHPDDRARLTNALNLARRGARPWEGRARLWNEFSATFRQVVVRSVPIRDGAGRIVEWIGTVADVDDQARMEDVLRSIAARLAALMRNAPVGFAFIDDRLCFQVVNEKLAEINGLAVEAHLGRDIRDVVPDLAAVNEEMCRRVLAGESILDTEIRGATPAHPDEPRDWLVNYYPVRAHAGQILGIGATIVDVTERNRLFAAERDARAAAEKTARLTEALREATAAVANLHDSEDIARAAADRLMATLSADAVLVERTDARGRIEDTLYASGFTQEDLHALRTRPSPQHFVSNAAIASRAPVFLESPDEFIARFPERGTLLQQLGARAWTVAPLVAADHVLGFVLVMFRAEHTFTADERRYVATVSDVVAQTMLRANARAAEALARRSTEVLSEAIAAERTRLAAVIHRMPAGLVVVDATNGTARVMLSNRRAAEILGRTPDNDDAHRWLSLRSPEGRILEPHETPLHRALLGDDTAEPEDTLVTRPDGTVALLRTSAVPIRDFEQRVTSAVLVIEDVTEPARQARDTQLLARVSDLLGAGDHVEETLEGVVRIPVPEFADVCALFILDGADLVLLAVSHYEPERNSVMREFLTTRVPFETAATPIADAVRTGQPVLMSEIPTEFDIEYRPAAESAWIREILQPSSLVVVPLRSGEGVTGVLAFCQTRGPGRRRRFTSDDLPVAVEVANRCASLLEQVVAHNETAQARDRADRLQRFAAEAARAASVDAVIEAITGEGVRAAGGYVGNVAMRLEHDSGFEATETRRTHPGAGLSWFDVEANAEDALTQALRSGKPLYFGDEEAYLAQFPDGRRVLAASATRAAAVLPLFASSGDAIGVVGFSYATAQSFDERQRALLEAIADVGAQSLDRARLYERERDVAGALQLALLPSALPELDNVETEARYIAGGTDVSVGGDWYDVLRFADGRVGLLIGDAAGRGVEAATLMGRVRHVAAALAIDHESPAAVLGRVNDYLHTIATRRSMVTCCYVLLDRDRGTLRYASAGHPPPILVEADGEPRFLTEGRGVPIGVIPTAVYTDAEVRLTSAATIVLYTDGLVERRREAIDTGLARLLEEVRGRDADVHSLCDHLTASLLADGGDDDVALLAARVCSVPDATRLEIELPADARRLHELRVRVSRWLADVGVDDAVIPDVVVALNEAASNSMVHAYAGTSRRGHVRVIVSVAADAVNATVTDDGKWREPRAGHDGRGIDMMHALMSDVRVERDNAGTRVYLRRAVNA